MARPKKEEALDAKAYIGVRIHNDLRDALDRIAKDRGVKLAEEVRAALEDHVHRADRKASRK